MAQGYLRSLIFRFFLLSLTLQSVCTSFDDENTAMDIVAENLSSEPHEAKTAHNARHHGPLYINVPTAWLSISTPLRYLGTYTDTSANHSTPTSPVTFATLRYPGTYTSISALYSHLTAPIFRHPSIHTHNSNSTSNSTHPHLHHLKPSPRNLPRDLVTSTIYTNLRFTSTTTLYTEFPYPGTLVSHASHLKYPGTLAPYTPQITRYHSPASPHHYPKKYRPILFITDTRLKYPGTLTHATGYSTSFDNWSQEPVVTYTPWKPGVWPGYPEEDRPSTMSMTSTRTGDGGKAMGTITVKVTPTKSSSSETREIMTVTVTAGKATATSSMSKTIGTTTVTVTATS